MAVAQRMYARALFEAAKDAGRVDVVHQQLADFAAALEQVPELRAVLENPQIDHRVKVQTLEDILGGADELVLNFVRLVAEKGRVGELDEMVREFEALVAQEQRRLTVELTTAVELSDDEAAALVQQIEQKAGRTVEATRSVDPALIGGVVIQAGSLRLDASVKTRLERLRRELVKGS
jgi:F-type H+-transporting ATPase subunit delta